MATSSSDMPTSLEFVRRICSRYAVVLKIAFCLRRDDDRNDGGAGRAP